MNNLGKMRKGFNLIQLNVLIIFILLGLICFNKYKEEQTNEFIEPFFVYKVEKSLEKNISKLDDKKTFEINRTEYENLNFKSFLVKEENGDISLLTTNTTNDNQKIKDILKGISDETLLYSKRQKYKNEYKNECVKGDGSDCYYKITLKTPRQTKGFEFVK